LLEARLRAGFCLGSAPEIQLKRDEKATVIDEIAAQIKGAEAIYALDYRGLTVAQAAELRARLREAGATMRVVKNTLTLRAADQAGAGHVKDLIEGPTAFTFVAGDPAGAAKALDAFARREQVLEVRGGVLGSELLTAEAVQRIARLPGREQLHAQIAGVVASPLTGLVRGLGSLLSGLAVALGQVQEKKQAEAPAQPAEEPKSEDPQPEQPQAEEAQAEETQAEATEAEATEAEATQEQPEGEAEPAGGESEQAEQKEDE
jgi:large subunit ribosomal protein L10